MTEKVQKLKFWGQFRTQAHSSYRRRPGLLINEGLFVLLIVSSSRSFVPALDSRRTVTEALHMLALGNQLCVRAPAVPVRDPLLTAHMLLAGKTNHRQVAAIVELCHGPARSGPRL